MYSKTRNTLTALTAASVFVVGGWLFGHPVSAAAPPQHLVDLQIAIADAGPQSGQEFTAMHVRHPNRMNLAMPYYSFALLTSPRRAD